MPSTCCVPNCDPSRNIAPLHKLPRRHRHLLDEWIRRIQSPKFVDLTEKKFSYLVVCSRHFNSYNIEPGNKRMMYCSVPTIDVPGFKGEPTKENSFFYPEDVVESPDMDNPSEPLIQDHDYAKRPLTVSVTATSKMSNDKIRSSEYDKKTNEESTKHDSFDDTENYDGDFFSHHQSFQEHTVVAGIIKSILYLLEQLVKSDPDTDRSSGARDKIILVLSCYDFIMKDKNVDSFLKKTEKNFELEISTNLSKEPSIVQRKIELPENVDDSLMVVNLPNNESKIIYCKEDVVRDNNLGIIKRNLTPMSFKKLTPLGNVVKIIKIVKKSPLKRIATDNIPMVSPNKRMRKVTRFVCDSCDVTLTSNHHLCQHSLKCRGRDVTRNLVLEEYWNNLSCPLCNYVGKKESSLKMHFISHKVKDLQLAFEPIREKEVASYDPKNNIKLFEDFLKMFKASETLELKQPAIDNSNEINQVAIQQDGANENTPTEIATKRNIDEFIKFKIIRVVFDIHDKKLYCNICDKLFNTNEELKNHLKTSNVYSKYACNRCYRLFPETKSLFLHTKQHKESHIQASPYLHHYSETVEKCPRQLVFKLYACRHCLMLFNNESHLRDHLNYFEKHLQCSDRKITSSEFEPRIIPNIERTENNRLQCPHCEKTFGGYYSLSDHFATHTVVDSPDFYCECGKSFKSYRYLIAHFRLKHRKVNPDVICEICGAQILACNFNRHMNIHLNIKPFKCDYCHKAYIQQTALNSHMLSHTGEKPWKCQYCEKSFSHKQYYNLHINIHEGKTPYKCSLCLNAFVSRGLLNKHMKYHSNVKPFKCDYCEKRFYHRANLTIHTRIHTGEKPWKCQYCEKAFIRKEQYNHHINIHEGKTPYKCSLCLRAFLSLKLLKSHENSHYNIKPFNCEYCFKGFNHKANLTVHVRTHTGEKPWKCQYCGKAFSQQSSLNTHVLIHTGEKPWRCQYCGKAFSQKEQYNVHINKHEGKTPYKCNLCLSAFESKKLLNTHMKRHQTTNVRSFISPLKSFPKKRKEDPKYQFI